jgi:hypothetical protein
VPINIHNVGIYFRDYFDNNYFESLENEH